MKKNKMRTLIGIIIAVSACLIACISVIALAKKALNEREQQIVDLETEIDANKKIVYVAMREIKAGEVLENGVNVMLQQIYSNFDEDLYVHTQEQLGQIALLNIDASQPIFTNMCSPLKITQDSREYEIDVANLMVDQKPDDYVDVRIMFPTGEDYLILAKKPVKNLIKENSIFYSYLNEDEILRMASATIDAYTVSGTYIYTTRYISSSLQEDAEPNYLVKPEVIDLINSDPNILDIATKTLNLNARIKMEERLKGLTEVQLEAIAAGHEIQDTAKSSVLLDVEYEDSYEAYGQDDTEDAESEENEGTESENSEETDTLTENADDISEIDDIDNVSETIKDSDLLGD